MPARSPGPQNAIPYVDESSNLKINDSIARIGDQAFAPFSRMASAASSSSSIYNMVSLPKENNFVSSVQVAGSIFPNTTVLIRFQNLVVVTGAAIQLYDICGTKTVQGSGGAVDAQEGWIIRYGLHSSNTIWRLSAITSATAATWAAEISEDLSAALVYGSWYCVGYVRDPSGADEAHLYLREISDPTAPSASEWFTDAGVTARYGKTGTSGLTIGGINSDGTPTAYGYSMPMKVDDFRVFDIAMDQATCDTYSLCSLNTATEPNLGCWIDFTDFNAGNTVVNGYNRDGADVAMTYNSGAATRVILPALCSASQSVNSSTHATVTGTSISITVPVPSTAIVHATVLVKTLSSYTAGDTIRFSISRNGSLSPSVYWAPSTTGEFNTVGFSYMYSDLLPETKYTFLIETWLDPAVGSSFGIIGDNSNLLLHTQARQRA